MSENEQNPKLHHEIHEKLESRISSRKTIPSRGENPEGHLLGRLTFATAICDGNDTAELYTLDLHERRELYIYKITTKD